MVYGSDHEIAQKGLDEAAPEDITRRALESDALVGDLLSVEVCAAKKRARREQAPRVDLRSAEPLVLLSDEGLDLREDGAARVGRGACAHGLQRSEDAAQRIGAQLRPTVPPRPPKHLRLTPERYHTTIGMRCWPSAAAPCWPAGSGATSERLGEGECLLDLK